MSKTAREIITSWVLQADQTESAARASSAARAAGPRKWDVCCTDGHSIWGGGVADSAEAALALVPSHIRCYQCHHEDVEDRVAHERSRKPLQFPTTIDVPIRELRELLALVDAATHALLGDGEGQPQ